MKKTIAILGVTGSVGRQAMEVAEMREYNVDLISADKNYIAAEDAARRLKPRAVVMCNEGAAGELRARLADTPVKVLSGSEALEYSIAESSAETVVNSILGEAGLSPTLATIKSGKRLALANKESLVIAGDIVMRLARERETEIIPVDSEHSAIFQSLKSGRNSEIRRIILTASGGPFFGKSREELMLVTLEDTLAHPTWKMGKKITVDSATLMNKGFEIIEAAHLFSVKAEQIEVVVHRESILHSAVEYIDNAVIGELSLPDMRSCVQYAVDYPERHLGICEPLDFMKLGKMTFMQPDEEAFPLLALAKRALSEGGGMGAVLNASDEIAVQAFLEGKIGFTQISDTVHSAYERMADARWATTLEDIKAADREARIIAKEIIGE